MQHWVLMMQRVAYVASGDARQQARDPPSGYG
jgi:hypothetical protein